MNNTTPKPLLSKLRAVHAALSALIEVELPTIQLDERADRKPRRQTKTHGRRSATQF